MSFFAPNPGGLPIPNTSNGLKASPSADENMDPLYDDLLYSYEER